MSQAARIRARLGHRTGGPAMKMPIADLKAVAAELAATGERVRVLWQEEQSLAFVARGREYRSEFHIDPADEVMLMIKGDMKLHYRTPEGKEEIAELAEGATIYTPRRRPPFAALPARCLRPGDREEAPRGRNRPLPVVLRQLRGAAARGESSRSATTPSTRYRRPMRGSSIRRRRGPAPSAAR